jgi:hypothetical protein
MSASKRVQSASADAEKCVCVRVPTGRKDALTWTHQTHSFSGRTFGRAFSRDDQGV